MAARLLFIKFGPSVDHWGGVAISADRFLLGVHKMTLSFQVHNTYLRNHIKEKSESISDPVHFG